jgi:hypothetical protein
VRDTVTLGGKVHQERIAAAHRRIAGERPRAEVDRWEILARSFIESGAVAFPLPLAELEELAMPGAGAAVRAAVVKRLVRAKVIRLSVRGRGVSVNNGGPPSAAC